MVFVQHNATGPRKVVRNSSCGSFFTGLSCNPAQGSNTRGDCARTWITPPLGDKEGSRQRPHLSSQCPPRRAAAGFIKSKCLNLGHPKLYSDIVGTNLDSKHITTHLSTSLSNFNYCGRSVYIFCDVVGQSTSKYSNRHAFVSFFANMTQT